jgi:colanic acid/amylovoran biosynthesis glycosyltransferase
MSASQIFVLASHTDPETGEAEGTPTVLLEAQATGLPVVSTVHADIPSIVADNVSGLLVPESDPPLLARAIGRLIRETELRLSMGEKGRQLVLGKHDSRLVGRRLEEIYEQLLATEESDGRSTALHPNHEGPAV